jgi:hypothetical protein
MTPAEERRHTPTIPIRVDPDLWNEFGRVVGQRNRSDTLRQFIRWMVREKGAKLPTRPDTGHGDSGPSSASHRATS